jgi:hypothetical protein
MKRREATAVSNALLIAASLALAVLLYGGGYFWFRSVHSGMTPSSTFPFTRISSTTWDSVLVMIFDPALRLDGRYGRPRTYIRTDASGDVLIHYKRYPFAEFEPMPNRVVPLSNPEPPESPP